jgi:hypothetical protein
VAAKSQLDRIEDMLKTILERIPEVATVEEIPEETVKSLAAQYGLQAEAGPGETLPYLQKPLTTENRPDPHGGAPATIVYEPDPEPEHFGGLPQFRGGEEPREVESEKTKAPKGTE